MIPRSGASYIVFGPEKYNNNGADTARRSGNTTQTSTPPAEQAIQGCGTLLGRCNDLISGLLENTALRKRPDCLVELSNISTEQNQASGAEKAFKVD